MSLFWFDPDDREPDDLADVGRLLLVSFLLGCAVAAAMALGGRL